MYSDRDDQTRACSRQSRSSHLTLLLTPSIATAGDPQYITLAPCAPTPCDTLVADQTGVGRFFVSVSGVSPSDGFLNALALPLIDGNAYEIIDVRSLSGNSVDSWLVQGPESL